ncbi:cysteine dioxygenase family protein [Roseomonas sp. OT10]|uniref:cysteine dioxygenase family protein n=1 Tax=Roseomonas cutis TaxID=2897332 RepID=UPI001E54697D|nr:cysteine dioxygenase family protein [Roseomonas sp. OT10]UFN51078.1 cysteine dioxygenase family protein [Roseomonas sp. OT10]
MNAIALPRMAMRRSLDSLLAAVADAVEVPLPGRPAAVARALEPYLDDPRLLSEHDCPCGESRYVRHLLHADPAGRYAVVALVWKPGQMSPIHAHRTWCALGVHRGTLTESHYRVDGALPLPSSAVLRRPGEVSHGPADPTLIHRLANLDSRNAVSIHVYGASYDRFGSDVNLVYAD